MKSKIDIDLEREGDGKKGKRVTCKATKTFCPNIRHGKTDDLLRLSKRDYNWALYFR